MLTFHQHLQKHARGNWGHAELNTGGKVLEIVSHYNRRLRSNGQLEDHVIAGIAQTRSPKVEDLLVMSLGAQIVHEIRDVLGSLTVSSVSKQDRFVLNDQRNRHCQLEQPIRDETEDLE
jgi:hypothetical protein